MSSLVIAPWVESTGDREPGLNTHSVTVAGSWGVAALPEAIGEDVIDHGSGSTDACRAMNECRGSRLPNPSQRRVEYTPGNFLMVHGWKMGDIEAVLTIDTDEPQWNPPRKGESRFIE